MVVHPEAASSPASLLLAIGMNANQVPSHNALHNALTRHGIHPLERLHRIAIVGFRTGRITISRNRMRYPSRKFRFFAA
jgi:hypothetical protein